MTFPRGFVGVFLFTSLLAKLRCGGSLTVHDVYLSRCSAEGEAASYCLPAALP